MPKPRFSLLRPPLCLFETWEGFEDFAVPSDVVDWFWEGRGGRDGCISVVDVNNVGQSSHENEASAVERDNKNPTPPFQTTVSTFQVPTVQKEFLKFTEQFSF